jgi:hypothetical protein
MTIVNVEGWRRLDVRRNRAGLGEVFDLTTQVRVSEPLPPADLEFLLHWVRERFPREKCPVHIERRRRRSRSFVPSDCRCTLVLETHIVNVLDQMVKEARS